MVDKLDSQTLERLGQGRVKRFENRQVETERLQKNLAKHVVDWEEILEKEGLGADLPDEAEEMGLIRGGSFENPEDIFLRNERRMKRDKEVEFSGEKEPPDNKLSGDSVRRRLKRPETGPQMDKEKIRAILESTQKPFKELWMDRETSVELLIINKLSLEDAKLLFSGNGHLHGIKAEITLASIIEALPEDKKYWFSNQSIDFTKPDETKRRIKNRLKNLYLGKKYKLYLGSENIDVIFPEEAQDKTDRNLIFKQEELFRKFHKVTGETPQDLSGFFTLYDRWKNGEITDFSVVFDNGDITSLEFIDSGGESITVPWHIFAYAYGYIKVREDINGKPIKGVRLPYDNFVLHSKRPETVVNEYFHSLVVGGKKLPETLVVKMIQR